MNKHILIFSRRCRYCEQVIQVLAGFPMDTLNKHFSLVDLDQKDKYGRKKYPRSSIPNCVKGVPTLLLNSNPNTLIVGPEDIINYLSPKNKGQSQGGQSQGGGQQQRMTGGRDMPRVEGGGGGGNNELLPSATDVLGNGLNFSFLEDENKTLDSYRYSYINDNQPSGQGGQSQNRGNNMGNNRGNSGGNRGGMDGRFTQNSGRIDKAALLDAEYEKMMSNRDVGIPSAIKRQ